MSDAEATPTPPVPATLFVVESGHPTDEEVAALVTVLGALLGGTDAPPETAANRWGQAIDGLRYPVVSWQQVTLLEREKMRRPFARRVVATGGRGR